MGLHQNKVPIVEISNGVYAIHIGIRRGSWGFTKTKSPLLRSLMGCMPSRKASNSLAHNKDT
jgi:hypothetical protein